MDNEAVKEKGIVGVFSRAAPTYDRIGPRRFAYFGERLVERAQLAPAASVLDVAAGRGAVLYPAAKRVGPRGRVIGIDLSSAMVRETTAEIRNAGHQNVELQLMDAEELRFPDAVFDWVLCGFGLWFFPHPQRALQEFLRVLKPGGHLGLTTWAKDSPIQTLYQDALRPHLPPPAGGQTPPSNFDTIVQIETALQQAGFASLQVASEDCDFVYSSEDEMWDVIWSSRSEAAARRDAACPARTGKSERVSAPAGTPASGRISRGVAGSVCFRHQNIVMMTRPMKTACFGWAVFAMLLGSDVPAHPQYPTKPIRLIVPTSTGSGADFAARLMSHN